MQQDRRISIFRNGPHDMENATFIGMSRQMVLERQMDLVANNIANMNTPAYKGERMVFVEYLAPATDGTLSYVQDIAQVRDTSEGSFTATGNPLDVAIRGDGYFTVNTPLGDRYTRNGRFSLDPTGRLVTSDGYPVLDSNNQPIVVPADATDVEIADDGSISTSMAVVPRISNQLGQLKLVKFANDQDLNKTGSGLYSTQQAPQPATGAAVVQGMVEESNVQPVMEITRMIATHRAHDQAETLISANDEMLEQAIQKLTQIN
jgi:flagellar basal-body rod protein FlgF